MLGILVVTASVSMLLMMIMMMMTCVLVLMRLDFMISGALGLLLTLSQVGKASFL